MTIEHFWYHLMTYFDTNPLPEDHQQSPPDSTSLSRQSPRCTHTQHCSRTAVMEECCKVFNIDLWQMHHLLVHNSHSKWRRCPKLKWLQKSWTLSYCMLNLVSGLLLRTYNVQKRLKVLFSPPLLLPTFHCSKKNIDDVQFMFCFLWSIKLLFPATTLVQLIYRPFFLFCNQQDDDFSFMCTSLANCIRCALRSLTRFGKSSLICSIYNF